MNLHKDSISEVRGDQIYSLPTAVSIYQFLGLPVRTILLIVDYFQILEHIGLLTKRKIHITIIKGKKIFKKIAKSIV